MLILTLSFVVSPLALLQPEHWETFSLRRKLLLLVYTQVG